MYSLIMAMGSTATTAGSSGTQGSMLTTFVTFGAIILIFYFLIIRPQKKRDKEAKDMLAAMKKGDKVVTIGGIRGTVAVVKESTVVIKVDDNTRIEFTKNAIAQILDAKPAPASSSKKDKADKVEKIEKPVENVEKPVDEAKESAPVEEALGEAAPADETSESAK